MAGARAPLYPYLVAVAFPLGLALSNVEELPGLTAAASVFGFVLLLTAALDGAGRLLIRDPERRALAVSIVLMFALGYGHIDVGLLNENVFSVVLLPSLLFGVVTPLLGLVLWMRNPGRLAAFVRTAAVALVCVQVATALPRFMAQSGAEADEDGAGSVAQAGQWPGAAGSARPDVYLLVFDAYARADMLKEHNQFDNSEFLDTLRARGFLVSDQARSNYMYTRLSLSSFLNMRYLDDDLRRLGSNPPRAAVDPLLHEFEVARRMKQLGYTYRHIGGYWYVTRSSPIADENVTHMPAFAEEFTFVFLAQTVFHPILKSIPFYGDWFQPGVIHLAQLNSVPKPEDQTGPVFTFAHVLCPHSPYVFDRHGIKGADSSLTDWERPLEYAEQVRYLNQQILKIVDEIDRVSGPDAIILLHGDHGARSQGQLGGTPEQVREQMATFAAYRVPPAARAAIYPGMSLVNNWRVVFTTVFGATDLPVLEDKTYYSDPDRIFDLQEVDLAGNIVTHDVAKH